MRLIIDQNEQPYGMNNYSSGEPPELIVSRKTWQVQAKQQQLREEEREVDVVSSWVPPAVISSIDICFETVFETQVTRDA